MRHKIVGRWFRGALTAWALACATVSSSSRAADEVRIETQRHGNSVYVSVRATIVASPRLAWAALTDYDRLADFVPGFDRSSVVGRDGATAFVRQQGKANFWPFSWPIDVVVASREMPPHRIDIRMVQGNLRRLEGAYRLEPIGSAIVLHWDGTIEPAESLPPWIGELVIRRSVEAQFLGMVEEIERRQGRVTSTQR